jgi:hypothetical protein
MDWQDTIKSALSKTGMTTVMRGGGEALCGIDPGGSCGAEDSEQDNPASPINSQGAPWHGNGIRRVMVPPPGGRSDPSLG